MEFFLSCIDLDVLRQCVEKSELWVYKSKALEDAAAAASATAAGSIETPASKAEGGIGDNANDDDESAEKPIGSIGSCKNSGGGGGGGATSILKKDDSSFGLFLDDDGAQIDHNQEYKKVEKILHRMNKLCVTIGPGDSVKPRKHEQRLLRNVGVHTIVLDLLQVPYDEKDTQMHELMRVAHKFLQNFCLGNQQNQILLHKQLDMFLNPGILDAETVCSIFKDNLALCNEVNEKVVQHFVHSIEIHGRHVEYLKFLQTIVKAENQFIRKCQDMVMQEVN